MKKFLSSVALSLFFILMAFPVQIASAAAFDSAGTGEWGNPLTWSPNGVPDFSNTDDARIVDAAHTVTVEADHSAIVTRMNADGELAIAQDATLTSPISVLLPDWGTLRFLGSNATLVGNASNLNTRLYQIVVDSNATGTVDGNVFAGPGGLLLDAGAVEGDTTEFRIASGHNLYGTVTTSLGGAGTLTSLGTNVIADQVGTDMAPLLAVNGGAGDGVTNYTTTFNSDVYAQTLNVTGQGEVALQGDLYGNASFLGDGTLTLDGNGFLSGDVTAGEDGIGTLKSLGDNEISGQVGTSGEVTTSILAVYGGAGDGETNYTTYLSSDVFAQTLYVTGRGTVDLFGSLTGNAVFEDDGILSLSGGGSINGSITTNADGQGTLDISGSYVIDGDIGDSVNALGSMYAWNSVNVYADNVYVDQITTCGTGCNLTFSPSESDILIRANINEDEEGGWDGTDYVEFYGNVDFAGNIGTESYYYSEVDIYGSDFEPTTVDLSGTIYSYYVWIYNDGSTQPVTLNIADSTMYYNWIGSDVDDTVVNFSGTNTFDGYIGDGGVVIAQVNFNSGATTLTSDDNGGPFWGEAADWHINGGSVLMPNGGTFYGPMTVHDGATLDVKDQPTYMNDGYAQLSGGILRLTIHDTGNHGTLNVSGGDATFEAGSKIQVDVAEDADIVAGDTFEVVSITTWGAIALEAPDVLDGSSDWDFDAATNDLGDGTWEIFLTAEVAETTSYAEQATNDNARGAGGVLDAIDDEGASGDMGGVLDTLNGLSSDEVAGALNSMLPDVSGAGPQGTALLMDNFIGTQTEHLGGIMDLARARGGEETGIAAGDEPGKYTTWVQAFGNAAHQDPRGTSNGYNLSNGGGAVGIEKVMSDRFRMGLAVGGAQGYVRSKDSAARTEILATLLSWYGGYNAPENPLYLQYALSYAFNDYNGSREINVGPADHRVANADFHGDLYGGMVEAGYGIKVGRAILTPTVGLNYNHLHVAKYSETDAGDLSLNVGAQDYDRLRTSVGLKFSAAQECKFGTVTPAVYAKYLYDAIAERQQIAAAFSGGGTAFSTEGFKPARSGADVGTSVTLATKKNMTVTLKYGLEIREDYYAHTGFLNVAFEF